MSPQGNRTGPFGQDPRMDRSSNQGRGRGRQPAGFGMGPNGRCVCTNPDCGNKIIHKRGVPCYQEKCPKCGSPMTREKQTTPGRDQPPPS